MNFFNLLVNSFTSFTRTNHLFPNKSKIRLPCNLVAICKFIEHQCQLLLPSFDCSLASISQHLCTVIKYHTTSNTIVFVVNFDIDKLIRQLGNILSKEKCTGAGHDTHLLEIKHHVNATLGSFNVSLHRLENTASTNRCQWAANYTRQRSAKRHVPSKVTSCGVVKDRRVAHGKSNCALKCQSLQCLIRSFPAYILHARSRAKFGNSATSAANLLHCLFQVLRLFRGCQVQRTANSAKSIATPCQFECLYASKTRHKRSTNKSNHINRFFVGVIVVSHARVNIPDKVSCVYFVFRWLESIPNR